MNCPSKSDDDNLYLVLDVEGGAASEAICSQGAKWTIQVQLEQILDSLHESRDKCNMTMHNDKNLHKKLLS
jgi:hypothetical protein